MIIKKLILENIRSYKNLEIEFPRGSTLLAGDIGSGKTSILLGLQFALFGLQPGQKGSSILRQGEDYASAKLEIEVNDQIIDLERSIKKNKNASITQESNIISINGQREEISTSEMKERVISILNYPKEFAKKSNLLYKFTVYTPQEEMKSIIEERPEIRLDTLRHIFGIDRYKRIKDNASIFLQKIKDSIKIKEILVSELNLLKEKFTRENESKIFLARSINDINSEFQRIQENKKSHEENLKEHELKIEEKRKAESELSKLKMLLLGKQDLELRMKKEIILMQKQVSEKVEFSNENLNSVLNLIETHKKIFEEKNSKFIEVNSKISVLESKKEVPLSLREKINSLENCPTCFQIVSFEHKDKISKRTLFEIQDISRELEQKIVELNQLSKELEKEKELIKGYESDKSKMVQDKLRLEHQKSIETKMKSDSFVLDRISNEVIDLKNQITKLDITLNAYKGDVEIYEKIKSEYKTAYDLSRKKELDLVSKNKELDLLKLRLNELEEEIIQKEKLREQLNYLRNLQDFLQDKFVNLINLTEKNVMAKLRADFSTIFSEWFAMLVSDSLEVRLDGDFTPLISNQGYDIEYDFLSGGERTAVALAYRLALNQVLNSMLSRIKTKDLVILDEPTDGFAAEQIDKMRDLFDQLKAKQTILVSHEQKIEGFVDHVIRIKKDGTSSIDVN